MNKTNQYLQTVSYILVSFLVGVSLQELCKLSLGNIYYSGNYFNIYSIFALFTALYTSYILNNWIKHWQDIIKDKNKDNSLILLKGVKASFVFVLVLLLYYAVNYIICKSFTLFLFLDQSLIENLNLENNFLTYSIKFNFLLASIFLTVTFIPRIAKFYYLIISCLFVGTYYKSFIVFKKIYLTLLSSDQLYLLNYSIIIITNIILLIILYVFLKSIIEFLIVKNCFSDWIILRFEKQYLNHLKLLLTFLLSKMAMILGIFVSLYQLN